MQLDCMQQHCKILQNDSALQLSLLSVRSMHQISRLENRGVFCSNNQNLVKIHNKIFCLKETAF